MDKKTRAGEKSNWGDRTEEMGCMPPAPKPPPYLQLCQGSPLLRTGACDPGSSKARWGRGLLGQLRPGRRQHLRVPRERPERRKPGGFRFYAKEVSQGCGKGGT